MGDNTTVYAALSKAQGNFAKLGKSGFNPFKKYYYVLLDDILDMIVAPLHDAGLTMTQTIDDGYLVTSLVYGETGETICSKFPMNFESDIQDVGAQLTYARRYSLSAMLGIVSEDDNDADSVDKKQKQQRGGDKRKPESKANGGTITEKQAKRLFAIAKGAGWSTSEMKGALFSKFGIDSSKDISFKEYDEVIDFFESPPVDDREDIPLDVGVDN